MYLLCRSRHTSASFSKLIYFFNLSDECIIEEIRKRLFFLYLFLLFLPISKPLNCKVFPVILGIMHLCQHGTDLSFGDFDISLVVDHTLACGFNMLLFDFGLSKSHKSFGHSCVVIPGKGKSFYYLLTCIFTIQPSLFHLLGLVYLITICIFRRRERYFHIGLIKKKYKVFMISIWWLAFAFIGSVEMLYKSFNRQLQCLLRNKAIIFEWSLLFD